MNKHNIDIDEVYERLMSTRRNIEAKYQKANRLQKEIEDNQKTIKSLEDAAVIIEKVLSEQVQLNLNFDMIFLRESGRYEYWLVDGEPYVRDHYSGKAYEHVNWGRGEFREVEDETRTFIRDQFEENNMVALYTNHFDSIIYFGVRGGFDLFKQIGNDDDERYEVFFWDNYEYLKDKDSDMLEKDRYITQRRKAKSII